MNKEIMRALRMNRQQYIRYLQSIVIETPKKSELPENKTDSDDSHH
ncbi:hypothetical protein OAD66_02590 [Bacteroidia bacterium]|nr:hypothetical protein [Bacteroidia bacterium]